MATLQDAMTLARSVIQDTDSTNYRYSDADLLSYGNQAIGQMAIVAGKLFYTTTEIVCIAGTPMQRLNGVNSVRLADILCVVGGDAVTVKDREALTTSDPGWMSTTPGPAQHWCVLGDDPNAFLIYPPAPAGQALLAVYVPTPPTYAATDPLPFSDVYTAPIAGFIAGMAESRDDVAVNTQKAQAGFQMFYAAFNPPGQQTQQPQPQRT